MSDRDRKAWRYTANCIPPGVVEEDDEDLSLGYSILRALAEETSLQQIAPGVYWYGKNERAAMSNQPSYIELQKMELEELRELARSMGVGLGPNADRAALISTIMQERTFPQNRHPEPGE
ncbi:Rho termination factor N-terminal domain-containing protein [Actinoplanes sp. NPDC049596]|uniref:Rho termination factor N-terminal domain-containing protein n=1 Tax=unclassified Actinoplanes TaxID=2626549 RepID=UPI00342CB5C0